MSAFTGAAKRLVVGVAVVPAAIAALAVSGTTTATADTFVRLPNGTAKSGGITIIKTGETARVAPSIAANGAGRSAWLSGKAKVLAPHIEKKEAGPNNGPRGEDAMPGSNGASTTGAAASLTVGYVVGCQVNLGNLDAGITGSIPSLANPEPGLGGALSLPLSPGKVQYVTIEKKQLEEPGDYFFNWDRAQLEIAGCAGHAQARSFVIVETTGDNHQKVSLFGKRFSVG
ncbi:MspA family porin [Gordonia sp. X0973]|uniref:MspA family porin n=1 Tax=Gordonia sp. X0973 TaxID=2742602 RepID=UPI000F54904D|nr:MspA family porin [Gordonia sp. X0973]QKT06550.1 MspA family porin [Gordonia sp. X0973]